MRRSTVVDAPPPADVVTPCAAPSTSQRKKGFATRWSLRRFIYSSPLIGRRGGARQTVTSSVPGGVVPATTKTAKDPDGKSSTSDHYHQHHVAEVHRAAASTRSSVSRSEAATVVPLSLECPLCFAELCPEDFCELTNCGHRACIHCLKQYLRVEITESRVCIACPECSEALHPNEIKSILDDQLLFEKYEDFMVRRVLAVDPDTRWCPAPDCSFAVIASECASCPKIRCERPGCDSYFCYHCKAEWHPNQTCDAARAQRSPNVRSSSMSYSLALDLDHREDIKACPRCQVLIVKMDDGSCNHMMCAVCGAEFCWLCMKEISDLHYLSPSGCTFWGKKPWSRKKKILWQLGTLVGAPVGIALVAGITVPAMIIGIPVWVGRKLYARYSLQPNNHKRNAAVVGGVVASIIISPILAGLAVGIGVPILLFYVYGVVPVSLCRSGGCGGAGAPSDDASTTSGTSSAAAPTASAVPPSAAHHRRRTQHDTASMTTMDVEASSRGGAASIGEAASLGAASGSHVAISVREEADRESASTVALAGSVAGWRSEVLAAAAVGSCKAPLACGESCICDEDCSVRFDDDVSFVYEGRGRCGDSSSASAVDGVVAGVEMQAPPPPVPPPMPQRSSTLSAELRSQFFALTGANGRGEESSKLKRLDWSKYGDIFTYKFLADASLHTCMSSLGLVLTETFGVPQHTVGVSVSTMGVSMVVFNATSAKIKSLFYPTDTHGRTRTLHGSLLYATSFLGLLVAPTYWMYVPWLVPMVASKTVLDLTWTEALVERCGEEEKGVVMGSFESVMHLAGLAVPLVSGVLLEVFGPRGPAVACLVPAFVGVVIAGRDFKNKKE